MSTIQQRAFPRTDENSDIEFSNTDGEDHQKGVTINKSPGGVCFTTDKSLAPGSEVLVNLDRNDFFGEVRWCAKKKSKSSSHMIGIRFIQEYCYRCGSKIPPREMNGKALCPKCNEMVDSISDENLRGEMFNYLSGNVI